MEKINEETEYYSVLNSTPKVVTLYKYKINSILLNYFKNALKASRKINPDNSSTQQNKLFLSKYSPLLMLPLQYEDYEENIKKQRQRINDLNIFNTFPQPTNSITTNQQTWSQ